jgi:hypothetical protein
MLIFGWLPKPSRFLWRRGKEGKSVGLRYKISVTKKINRSRNLLAGLQLHRKVSAEFHLPFKVSLREEPVRESRWGRFDRRHT